jgi:hypothetical protein
MGKAGSRGRTPPRMRSSALKAAQARGVVDNQRGELSEAAFIHKAVSLGFVVATPRGHNLPYDFIVEGGGGFVTYKLQDAIPRERAHFLLATSSRSLGHIPK